MGVDKLFYGTSGLHCSGFSAKTLRQGHITRDLKSRLLEEVKSVFFPFCILVPPPSSRLGFRSVDSKS